MGTLGELGLNGGAAQLSLVNAPDSVLAEASAMKPRPAFASSLAVAQPRQRIAWWPEPGQLTPISLSRLTWLVSVAQAQAWLVFGPEEEGEGLSAREVRAAVESAGMHVTAERVLASGEVAVGAEVHLPPRVASATP